MYFNVCRLARDIVWLYYLKSYVHIVFSFSWVELCFNRLIEHSLCVAFAGQTPYLVLGPIPRDYTYSQQTSCISQVRFLLVSWYYHLMQQLRLLGVLEAFMPWSPLDFPASNQHNRTVRPSIQWLQLRRPKLHHLSPVLLLLLLKELLQLLVQQSHGLFFGIELSHPTNNFLQSHCTCCFSYDHFDCLFNWDCDSEHNRALNAVVGCSNGSSCYAGVKCAFGNSFDQCDSICNNDLICVAFADVSNGVCNFFTNCCRS